LYWNSPEQLAFRFNLAVFNEKIETIGTALPFENTFLNTTLFLRGANSDYILDADFETISHHFPNSKIETVKNAGHWLHAENPTDFFQFAITFLQ
jgi:esterase